MFPRGKIYIFRKQKICTSHTLHSALSPATSLRRRKQKSRFARDRTSTQLRLELRRWWVPAQNRRRVRVLQESTCFAGEHVFCPPKTEHFLMWASLWPACGVPHRTPKLRAGVVYSCRFFCGLGQRVEACLSTPVIPHKQK